MYASPFDRSCSLNWGATPVVSDIGRGREILDGTYRSLTSAVFQDLGKNRQCLRIAPHCLPDWRPVLLAKGIEGCCADCKEEKKRSAIEHDDPTSQGQRFYNAQEGTYQYIISRNVYL
jgi:hypothetical protein